MTNKNKIMGILAGICFICCCVCVISSSPIAGIFFAFMGMGCGSEIK
jgi:hypothetical protein